MVELLTLMTLLGLVIGSFLNVVIHRLPARASLSVPASHCPACQAPIRARHNVPVIGWLLLRGRCADCAADISIRYPLVELLTALLFFAVSLRLEHLDRLPALPAYLCLVACGVALTFIDIDTHRLPNAIVVPAYPVLALLLTAGALWQHDGDALVRAAVGGAALFGFYFLLAIIYPAGMGFGDVKLAGVLGGSLAYLSWSALAIGAFAGFFLGAVIGTSLLLAKRATRKTALPFGPFMITGALVAVLAASEIGDAYSQLLVHG